MVGSIVGGIFAGVGCSVVAENVVKRYVGDSDDEWESEDEDDVDGEKND